MMDPRTLSEQELVRTLRARAAGSDRELKIQQGEDGTWGAALRLLTPVAWSRLAEPAAAGAATQREALEQLWLSLDVENQMR